MFLSNQIIFLYMCEPNLTNFYHVEIISQSHKLFSTQVGITYVNSADLFNNIFVIHGVPHDLNSSFNLLTLYSKAPLSW